MKKKKNKSVAQDIKDFAQNMKYIRNKTIFISNYSEGIIIWQIELHHERDGDLDDELLTTSFFRRSRDYYIFFSTSKLKE